MVYHLIHYIFFLFQYLPSNFEVIYGPNDIRELIWMPNQTIERRRKIIIEKKNLMEKDCLSIVEIFTILMILNGEKIVDILFC